MLICFMPNGPIFLRRLMNKNAQLDVDEMLVANANPLIPIIFDNIILSAILINIPYDEFFTGTHVRPLLLRPEVQHAYHLYVVKVPERNTTFKKMRAANIGANVHYMPVYLHPYYQNLGYAKGLCPAAETAYSEILTLPLWPGMCEKDVKRVAEVLLSE